jgi:hypothetical protein
MAGLLLEARVVSTRASTNMRLNANPESNGVVVQGSRSLFQLGEAGHVGLVGGAHDGGDAVELVRLVLAREQRLAQQHLRQDAA